MKIKLENDFHRTSAVIIAEIGDVLTDRQIKRANSKLCGMSDCTCSGSGIHGYSVTKGVRLDDRSGMYDYHVRVCVDKPGA